MSVILALDSSSDACSVALLINGQLHARHEIASKSHTQRLLPMVDELLAEHELGLAQLDAIAFGRGPGSFTGLRICMGVVQGLAFGSARPVLPVSTLEAIALQVQRTRPAWQGRILVALDARMSEVYWALFDTQNGQLQRLGDEYVTSPEALLAHDLLAGDTPLLAAGSGFSYAPLQALAEARATECWLTLVPRAEDIALLAAPRLAAGEAQAIADAELVYLRDSVSWQKRQRIRPQGEPMNEQPSE